MIKGVGFHSMACTSSEGTNATLLTLTTVRLSFCSTLQNKIKEENPVLNVGV